MVDKSRILYSIKKHLNFKTNKEFANFLEIKEPTLSMWHKRNTFDVELLFKKCEFLNAEWLLTGNGNMLKSESNAVQETQLTYLAGAAKEPPKKNLVRENELLYKHIAALENEIDHLKKELQSVSGIKSNTKNVK